LLNAVLEAGAGLAGLGDVAGQPGAFARGVGGQVQAELLDQVEPRERPPPASAASIAMWPSPSG
jgi:hypothetical protein